MQAAALAHSEMFDQQRCFVDKLSLLYRVLHSGHEPTCWCRCRRIHTTWGSPDSMQTSAKASAESSMAAPEG